MKKEVTSPKIRLNLNDAVYPVCTGGFCRSKALWAILEPICNQIVLFPPHAARVGWDPYNGQINRYKNYAQEVVPDEFNAYFGMEKAERFGFENISEWKIIEQSPTNEGAQYCRGRKQAQPAPPLSQKGQFPLFTIKLALTPVCKPILVFLIWLDRDRGWGGEVAKLIDRNDEVSFVCPSFAVVIFVCQMMGSCNHSDQFL